jgi:hypothetical protein
MIKKLVKLLTGFSVINHMHCFLHVVNLVAKSLIQQFDLPKKIRNEQLGDADRELYDVTENLVLDKTKATAAHGDKQGEDEESDDDDLEGWIDKQEELMAKERKQLHVSTRPFKLTLANVSR